ncbi:MAG: molybdenum cofactor guanylyltransferase MobA [Magnetococcales bacterium]|nr:molybdenum cofactor guanylyltransferase MobA [Magnetococcales bacterium]
MEWLDQRENPAIDTPECRAQLWGIVLAGGLSRRMGGREKAFLTLRGEPLLTHALRRLTPQTGRIAVNAAGDAARFAPYGVTVIPDRREGHRGPLAGVEAAFLATGAPWLLTIPVDAPFLPMDLAQRLWQASDNGQRPTLARSGGRLHPVFGLWPRGLLPAIDTALAAGDSPPIQRWSLEQGAAVVEFPLPPHGPDPFFNVNAPEDLAQAEAWLAPGAVH